MAEGGEPSTSRASLTKEEKFLSEPIGDKLVTDIPGIELAHARKLRTKGIQKAYVVLGAFLALNKDEDDFAEWLRAAAGTNRTETRVCYRALQQWSEKFI